MRVDRVTVRHAPTAEPALENVSLELAPGAVTALLGPNGAGKSTLLRVAAGLTTPTSGTVLLDGTDLRALRRTALALRVAFVPQTAAVPHGFRVRDVVAMGRAPHQGAWMREGAADRAAVANAIDRCDLAPLVDRFVEELSGGEQGRVAIARAIAQAPRILLLDEPAAFLDVRHRLRFHEILAEVAAENGIACAVATHDFDGAARFASHVVLLRQGRIVASGTPDEVMTAERIADAFDVEVVHGVHDASGRAYFVPLRVAVKAAVKAPGR
jgi:iron complex transport system ATP-binding protein